MIHYKAGERILEDLQSYAEEKIREERIPGKLSIFENNTDFARWRKLTRGSRPRPDSLIRDRKRSCRFRSASVADARVWGNSVRD